MEVKLERLLERLQHVREHYAKQDISKFRKEINDLGSLIHQNFSNVLGVFSVGYPHYTPDNYVPPLLMQWFNGKLGYALDKCDSNLHKKIEAAYKAAREDIDLFLVLDTEDGLFQGRSFREIDQSQLVDGDGKIFDLKALDNVIKKSTGIGLHAFEDPHKDALVIDQTIIPKDVWLNLRNDWKEWQNTGKWGNLGIDIMFSMVKVYSKRGYNFIDEFRYRAIQNAKGKTPSEKIGNIGFLPNTPHSELLKDPVVYAYWKMRMLESYTNYSNYLKTNYNPQKGS